MDSGSSKEFDAGTAGIDDAQVEWYNWNMNAFEAKCGEKPTRKPAKGGAVTSFAVGLWDQKVPEKLIERRPDAELLYYLGNLHYDRRNCDTAARIADSFADYAAANKGKHVKTDYFAVSLPDLPVWELDLDRRNDEMCDCLPAMAKKIKRVTGGEK